MATSPLKEVTGEEIAPGAHLQKDDELLNWVRKNAETTDHVGSKKLKRQRSRRVKQGWHSGAEGCPVEFWGRSTTPFAEGRGRGLGMDWARMLAYVTGTVDQELLARNEYLAAENP
jgi:hypothetical protein